MAVNLFPFLLDAKKAESDIKLLRAVVNQMDRQLALAFESPAPVAVGPVVGINARVRDALSIPAREGLLLGAYYFPGTSSIALEGKPFPVLTEPQRKEAQEVERRLVALYGPELLPKPTAQARRSEAERKLRGFGVKIT